MKQVSMNSHCTIKTKLKKKKQQQQQKAKQQRRE